MSPPGPAERWNCAKGVWLWELGYVQANRGVIFDEVADDRRRCPGFRRWRPGRSPAQHLESEEKAVDFWHQLVLRAPPCRVRRFAFVWASEPPWGLARPTPILTGDKQ